MKFGDSLVHAKHRLVYLKNTAGKPPQSRMGSPRLGLLKKEEPSQSMLTSLLSFFTASQPEGLPKEQLEIIDRNVQRLDMLVSQLVDLFDLQDLDLDDQSLGLPRSFSVESELELQSLVQVAHNVFAPDASGTTLTSTGRQQVIVI